MDRTGKGQGDVLAVVNDAVQAIDGRTGKTLWTSPQDLREERHWSCNSFAFCVRAVADQRVIDVSRAGQLLTLDLRNGALLGPAHELRSRPEQPPLTLDPHGPGQANAFLFERSEENSTTLEALDLATRKTLWQEPLGAKRSKNEPVLADLGGKQQVIVVGRTATERKVASAESVLEVRVLDAATGQPRWKQRLWTTGEMVRLIVGEDLNGDGHRELFAATLVTRGRDRGGWYVKEFLLHVETLSGKDGTPLWRCQRSIGFDHEEFDGLPDLAPLRWWQVGPDGRPLLLVSFPGDRGGDVKRWRTLLLASGSGQLVHHATGAAEPFVADLDGDGLSDLVRFTSRRDNGTGKLSALRGLPPATWQRLRSRGDYPRAVADLNGDGFADLIKKDEAAENRNGIRAVSGRDGRTLWTSALVRGGDKVTCLPLGSNLAALLALGDQHLQALSARDGQLLWSAPLGVQRQISHLAWLSCHDLAGAGEPNVLTAFTGTKPDDSTANLQLMCFNDRTGAVRWTQSVEGYSSGSHDLSPLLVDLNGDGVRDLVFWSPMEEGFHLSSACLQVVSGKDGSVLWKGPTSKSAREWFKQQQRALPAVGDLDGSGVPQVVMIGDGADGQQHVLALNGPDGSRKWSWSAADANAGRPEERQPMPNPVVLRLAGRSAVCVVTTQRDASRLTVLAGGGQVVGRADFELPANRVRLHDVRSFDLDEDGRDEVLIFNGRVLRVWQGDVQRQVWHWTAATRSSALVEIRRSGPDHPATVVMRDGDHLLGLDGKTGAVRWRGLAERLPSDAARAILTTDHREDFPWLIDEPTGVTLVRPVLRTDAAGKYDPALPAATTYPPLPSDPRFARPLPWAEARPPGDLWTVPLTLALLLGLVTLLLLRRRRKGALILVVVWLLIPPVYGLLHVWIDARRMEVEEHYVRGSLWSVWLELNALVFAWVGVMIPLLALSTAIAALILWARAGIRRARSRR